MAGRASAVATALHIALTSPGHGGPPARACAALRPAPLAPCLRPQPAHSGGAQRRNTTHRVAESAQAAKAPQFGGGTAQGGGGGGGGSSAWQPMVAALEARQPEAAMAQLMGLLEQGILPPNAVCDRLIYALCRSKRVQQARRALAAAAAAGYCPAYNAGQALISAALAAGDLEAALEAFRGMQAAGRVVNVVTYCGLISALGRERRRRGVRYAQTAHELWCELAASGVVLDAAAYRTGLKACVDVGRLREADRLLARMAAAGAAPDARAYNILLAGHSRAANTGAMARLLQRMAAAGVAPSAVTFNTLADGYVRAGDLAAAKAAAARAAAAGLPLDVWGYSTLVKGYVREGQLAAAEAVLGDMAAAGVAPSCVTFTTLLDGHVRAGDMGAARRVLQAMLAAGQAPNALTYNALLRGYAAAAAAAAGGRDGTPAAGGGAGSGGAAPAVGGVPTALAAALGLLRDMQAGGVAPTTDTFNTLMAAAVAAGEHRLALELGARLRRAGLRPDGLTYTVLIQAHGRLGQPAEAATAFEALLRDRSAAADLSAYNALVDALARNGDMPAAERMLAAAADLASKQGLPPPVEAFGAVVAGYARQLLVPPAVAAVKRFHAAGGSPDEQMLDVLANAAIRGGDYKVAMQAVRALELVGREVDRAKYAALLEEARARQGEAAADADRPQHNRTWAAYQRRRDARRRNVQLERFKFWLGLPNSYYSASDVEGEPGDELVAQREWRQDEWEQQLRQGEL